MSTQEPDVWGDAENPQLRSSGSYWGKAVVLASYVVLIKGEGKLAYDPQKHGADLRRTGIDISIDLLADMGLSFPVERNFIAESKLWAGTVLPTIKALGISVRELNNCFVKVSLKATGRTFEGRDKTMKEETTILFEKLFADENACRADYLATKTSEPEPAAADPTNGNNKEKETAAKFLKVIVENAARGEKDITAIQAKCATAIANMPLVSRYFSSDSIEVINLIAEKVV